METLMVHGAGGQVREATAAEVAAHELYESLSFLRSAIVAVYMNAGKLCTESVDTLDPLRYNAEFNAGKAAVELCTRLARADKRVKDYIEHHRKVLLQVESYREYVAEEEKIARQQAEREAARAKHREYIAEEEKIARQQAEREAARAKTSPDEKKAPDIPF